MINIVFILSCTSFKEKSRMVLLRKISEQHVDDENKNQNTAWERNQQHTSSV